MSRTEKITVRFLSVAPFLIIVVSALAAIVIGWNFQKQRQQLEVQIHQSSILKEKILKDRIEDYFNIIGCFPVFVSMHEDVQAMNDTAKTFVRVIYEERYEQHKLSEIYIIERDFDGTHPPFMTYEHGEEERSVEEVHDLESEKEEYREQIEHIRKFLEDPSLKVQISSPVKLCVDKQGIIYSVPVRNDQEFVGIVSGMVPLENISNILERADLGLTSFLINERGDVIYCNNPGSGVKLWIEKQIKGRNTKGLFDNDKKALELDGYVCSITELDIVDTDRWYLATVQCVKEQLASHAIVNPSMGYIIAVMSFITGIILASLCYLLRKKIIAEQRERLANEAKSQFLANMSHEIRTPMNAIIGFTDVLAGEDLTKEQFGYLKIVSNSGRHLLQVINDILDFSKIEADKLEIELTEFCLDEKLNEIQALFSLEAEGKGLEFRVNKTKDLPSMMCSDSSRIYQCLMNLVNNAIKFTENGHVHVNVSLEKRDCQPFIRFDVEDTGIGISHDKQETIFEAFAQADGSTSRKYGGTGLGLSITKKLAVLLGGDLTLNSQEGKGSVFSLILAANADISNQTPMEMPVETDQTGSVSGSNLSPCEVNG